MATSFTSGDEAMLSSAAPEQRPPDPIMPILIVESPAACTARLSASVPIAAPVAASAESFRKRRRVVTRGEAAEAGWDMVVPHGW